MEGITGDECCRSKQERLRVFFNRLMEAEAANSHDQALMMLETLLNAVEDELSGLPFNLSTSNTDGRIYPPLADNVRAFKNAAGDIIGTRRRSTFENTYIINNGAIRILSTRSNAVLMDKPGADRKLVDAS